MSGPVIETRQVTKCYGDKKVLKEFSYKFYPGKIYGMVGPSGAGKSTLLRILDLLEQPTGGEIFYRGKAISQNNADRLAIQRKLAMVFQQPVLFSGTVLDNVYYGLKVRGKSFAASRAKLNEALSLVGLDGKEKQKATTLSGGEAQRLALARTVVLEPEVLLLDEPTANLDPANIKIIEKLLKNTKEKNSTTIIMVTHNLFQAKRLADEVLFLYDGELIEAKPVEEMFINPAYELTRAFIKGELVC